MRDALCVLNTCHARCRCGVVATATGSCNRASGKTQWKCKCSNKRM